MMGRSTSTLLLVGCFLLAVTDLILARYTFRVVVHTLENRGARCADEQFCNSGEGCCESSTCAVDTCQYELWFCERKQMNPSLEREVDNDPCSEWRKYGPYQFEREISFNDFVLRPGNPILRGGGLQAYFELRKYNDNVLIDRMVINSPSIVDYHQGPLIVRGVFGLAVMNVSTSVVCNNDDCGQYCEIEDDCSSCPPGYTGIYCSEMIRICTNSLCSNRSNTRCVDRDRLEYECECLPGYTGDDCQEDVNECSDGVERCLFNGQCVNDKGSYHCECDEHHTGENCETVLPRYNVDVTFHSFENDGMCADVGGTCASGTGCCESDCTRGIHCNYMFLFCLRPFRSALSTVRTENRGGDQCNATETNSEVMSSGGTFSSSVLGVSNPIKYSLVQSPFRKQEFYIELLDNESKGSIRLNNDLVDRFLVPITGNISYSRVHGIFNLSVITLSLSVHCSEYYTGDECDQRVLQQLSAMTTPQNRETTVSNSTARAVATAVVATIIFLLLVACMISVICCVVCTCRRKAMTKSDRQQRDMMATEMANIHADLTRLSERRNSSVRGRLESISNAYNRLKTFVKKTQNESSTREGIPSPWTQSEERESRFVSQYEEISESANESGENSSSGRAATRCANNSRSNAEYSKGAAAREEYGNDEYGNDEYDYYCPYWEPSNKEKELLMQVKKLRITNIANEEIKELDAIGSGAFGIVSKASWTHKGAGGNITEELVAIKKIQGEASEDERVLFLKEAVTMGQFSHPNIVKMLGIVATLELSEYKILMEFLANGNLRQYLPTMNKSSDVLSSQLLAFTRQIASGMNYLFLKGFVHRDLAARNVLVTNNDTCKIADFGLSRDVCSESFYLAKKGKIPVKWSAPESIQYRLWSSASDVWSYGCILFEIWSLGCKPFHTSSNAEVLQKLSRGERLPPPPGCPRFIYKLMIDCWNEESDARPAFSWIVSDLNEPEYKITGWSEEDKLKYSNDSRKLGGALEDGKLLFVKLQNTYLSNT